MEDRMCHLLMIFVALEWLIASCQSDLLLPEEKMMLKRKQYFHKKQRFPKGQMNILLFYYSYLDCPWTLCITLELKNHNRFQLSFVLFVRSLQDGQNHLLATVNSSGPNFYLMDLGTEEVKGRVIISTFSSQMLQQRQMLQVNDAWWVGEMILSAIWYMPFNSSITICKISGTSCWLLKLKGDPRSLVMLFL